MASLSTSSYRADYYPFGMPMPNRHTTDGDYRYAYQGQEKDKETNKEAFELRLWDSRIGRWLTTDPAGQYASPYLGMGNDPINGIDPDGGYKTRLGRFFAWVGGGFKGNFFNNSDTTIANDRFGIINFSKDNDGFLVGTLSFGSKSEAINSLDSGLNFLNDFSLGVKDFSETYREMVNANLLNSDKYFHSKANFKAALRGKGGEYAAEKISNLREIFDQRIKGDTRQDALEDQEANIYGRERGRHYRLHGISKVHYKEAIPKYRSANKLIDQRGY